jgi:multidrug transporter EmrE-like cation transporter
MPKRLAYQNAAMARVVAYVADHKLRQPPVTFKYSAPVAIMLLDTTLSLQRSVTEGQASMLVPIAQIGFVVVALLGILVLREPVTICKMIGLVTALAALAALARGLKVCGRPNCIGMLSVRFRSPTRSRHWPGQEEFVARRGLAPSRSSG